MEDGYLEIKSTFNLIEKSLQDVEIFALSGRCKSIQASTVGRVKKNLIQNYKNVIYCPSYTTI